MEYNGEPKIIREVTQDGVHRGYVIWCPGCDSGHMFDDRWVFNGDHERPTFIGRNGSSSMLVSDPVDGIRCHSYVVNGTIQFLNDCTHNLRGQTVPLEKF